MRARRINAAVLAALPALAVGCSLYYCGNAAAATLYYNPAVSNVNWGAANWNTLAATPYSTGWTDGSDAVFSDTAQQNITVDANYTANTVQNASPTANELLALNGNGTTTLTTTAFVNQSSTYSTDFYVYNVSLGGSDLSVTGYRPVLAFEAADTSVTPYSGTITFDSGTNPGTFYISGGAAPLSGPNTNVVVGGNGEYIEPQRSVTMGSLSSPAGTNTQIFAGAVGDPTLTVNENTNTTYAGSFVSASGLPMTFALAGTQTLTMAAAMTNLYTAFQVNGGNLQVAHGNNLATASTYIPVAVSNGGILSNATSLTSYLVGNSNTYNTATGQFTGVNTNGYTITTNGTTSYIDPTGIFGLTQLNATAGGAEGFYALGDLLSVLSLTTANANAGNFVIDSSGLTGFTPGTPYNVLQWVDFTGELGDFTAIAPAGYTASLDISGDDLQVTFTAVPEPATAAMLLAAVPLMLRRRRTQVESA